MSITVTAFTATELYFTIGIGIKHHTHRIYKIELTQNFTIGYFKRKFN